MDLGQIVEPTTAPKTSLEITLGVHFRKSNGRWCNRQSTIVPDSDNVNLI